MAHCQKPSVTPGLFVRGVLLLIKKAAKKSPTRRPGAFLGQSYLSSVSPGTLAVSDEVPSTSAFMRLRPKRSDEHTSELQSLMRISYAVLCFQQKIRTYLKISLPILFDYDSK